MYLNRLYIENYRSIQKLDLKFSKGRNVIVGKNNAGKSNIIKAIDLILGEKSPTWDKSDNITDTDFFEGNTSNEIFIWCELIREENEFLDLSESKGAFSVLKNKSNSLIERMEVDFSLKDNIFEFCSEEGQIRSDEYFYKIWIGTKSYCKRGFNQEFANIDNFAFAFRCKKEGDRYNKEMMFFYRSRIDPNWIFSVNANLRNELLQSAIIPSFRDPKDQLKISSYSWYGKLLKEYIKNDSPELSDAFEKVKDASNELFKGLQTEVCCSKIQIAFPNTKISFQFNPDSRQDVYKSTLIYVDDGFNSKLDEKGAGIQSSVIIGLFDYYIRNVAHTNGSLLAIEEPELYLHPHGRRVISDRLDTFLDDSKNQVIITTHSPEFVCCLNENINLIIVTKNGNQTLARKFYFDNIRIKQILIKKQNAEMFFADAVIFVEGADKYIFEIISEEIGNEWKIITENLEKQLLGKNWLNDYNVSVINCTGKKEFWKYVKVFNEIGIPWLIVADFDFLRDGLPEFFTKLSYDKKYSDKLNALKSHIHIPSNCKSINSIQKADDRKSIINYIDQLKAENIFILTGELENFYLIPYNPNKDKKEQTVLEIIENCKIENKSIREFVKTDEFEDPLKKLIKTFLMLKLDEKLEIPLRK
jgi:predicted ATP-dependent endonuclease of OLD family